MVGREQMNARRPEQDEFGNAVLERMNKSHNTLYLWGAEQVHPESCRDILDIGCGGGKNIANLLSMTGAKLYGIDYSRASVEKTLEVNREAAENGRVEAIYGSAEALPYPPDSFDLVTAFETVYYWKGIEACFKKVYEILRSGGEFLVCNEDRDTKRIAEVAEALEMTLYTADELEALLKGAGFTDIRTISHENGRWVSAVGKKA